MAKNELYSYEYLRQLFALDSDPADLKDEDLKQHNMVLVGRPDEIIEKIEEFQKGGLDQLICFKQAGRIPHANIMKSIKLFAKEVMPHFSPHRSTVID